MFQEIYGGVIAMKLRSEFAFLQYGWVHHVYHILLIKSVNNEVLWRVTSLLIGWSSE